MKPKYYSFARTKAKTTETEEEYNICDFCKYLNQSIFLLRTNLVPKGDAEKSGDYKVYTEFTKFETQLFSFIESKDNNVTLTQIAQGMDISAQRLTYPVNKLVKLGFLKRTQYENDKKSVYISTTDKLSEIALAFNELMEGKTQRRLDSALTKAEQTTLCNAMRVISSLMSKLDKKRVEVQSDSSKEW